MSYRNWVNVVSVRVQCLNWKDGCRNFVSVNVNKHSTRKLPRVLCTQCRLYGSPGNRTSLDSFIDPANEQKLPFRRGTRE